MEDAQRLFWHYTSWDALEKILQSKQLRGSNIGFLNDAAEYRCAVDRLIDDLNEVHKARFARPLPHIQMISSTLLNNMLLSPPFVASLSTAYDDLSQWRAYAKASQAVALGFDDEAVRGIAANNNASFERCIYESSEHRAALSSIVQQFAERLPIPEGVSGEELSKRIMFAVNSIVLQLTSVAPTIKHETFSAEKEWRFIFRPNSMDEKMGFHQSYSMVVPHYPIELVTAENPVVPLQRIIVGPHPHIDKLIEATRALAWRHKLFSAEVHPTKVPYRNW